MTQPVNFTFRWPSGPEDVILTGTFDEWKGSLPLVKTSSGDFEITMPLKQMSGEEDKFYFKFIVDGDWTVSDEYEKESDGCGFENNFIDLTKHSSITEAGENTKNQTRIPEAGGLAVTSDNDNKDKTITTETKDQSVHILPVNELPEQFVAGGPGPVIPENAQNIKEFSEERDVDVNELNERLNREMKEKKEQEKVQEQTVHILPVEGSHNQPAVGGPGPVIPENAKDIKELSEIRDVDVDELNERLNKEIEEKKEKEGVKNESVSIQPVEESHEGIPIDGLGPMVPENAKDIKEFSEIRDVDAKELNERLNKELRTKKELAKSEEPTSSTISHSGSTDVKSQTKEETEPPQINTSTSNESPNEHELIENLKPDVNEVEKVPASLEQSNLEHEQEESQYEDDRDQTIEAEIPIVETEELENKEQDVESPELLPVNNAKTDKEPVTAETTENSKSTTETTQAPEQVKDSSPLKTDSKKDKTGKPTKKGSIPSVKSTPKNKEETKKPKKGLFGKLKKLFT